MNIHSRRAVVEITYEGVNITKDIAPYLLSFRYTDNGNSKADDVQITLQDRDGKWRYKWMPIDGDKIIVSIVLYHWEKADTAKRIPCGTFYIDAISYNGPPDVMTIGAVSYPIAGGLKREKKTKSWEKVSLRTIASSIATAAQLKLIFETSDVKYDRMEQTEQSDIAFLANLAEKEGASVKVTNDSIVIYDDYKFENTAPVRDIERGVSNIKQYNFQRNYDDASYAKCTISYTTTAKKKTQTITGSYTIPGAKGPTLKLQQRVESTAEAVKRAKNELRNRNKQANTASFTLVGDPKLVQGVTVDVLKFSNFNGKYFIDSATHSIGSGGYETSIQCRKVLTF
ncbi:MAG: phage late control D family protein [Candidatus Pristimantibacillus sp.]